MKIFQKLALVVCFFLQACFYDQLWHKGVFDYLGSRAHTHLVYIICYLQQISGAKKEININPRTTPLAELTTPS